MLKKEKILITGGLGFIGSFLAKELISHQNQVVLCDQAHPESTSASEMGLLSHPSISCVRGDILDEAFLATLPTDFDRIVHTAGVLGIRKVCEKPVLTASVNAFGTQKLLEFARKQKHLKRFLHFSTSEIYGTQAQSSQEEDSAVIPNTGMRWVYASSKHFSEYLVKAYVAEYQIPGVIVRPFNVFGPHRKGGNAMTTLIQKALRKEEIQIDGNGLQTRAWCYIDDFITGIRALLTQENILGHAFNLGDDREPISMLDLAKTICHCLSSSSKIHILHNQTDDVLNRCPNIGKARSMLGYSPQVNLKEGILKTAEKESASVSLLCCK